MEQLIIINPTEEKQISLIVLLKDSADIIKIDEILVYKKALNYFKNTYEYTIAGLSINGNEKKFEHYILEQKDIELIELSIH